MSLLAQTLDDLVQEVTHKSPPANLIFEYNRRIIKEILTSAEDHQLADYFAFTQQNCKNK